MDKKGFEKEAGQDVSPMFHPVFERGESAWFPSNETGSIASIISHTWEDILCLFNIRRKSKTDYENRLLFKYIVIELKSVIDQLEKLQRIIFTLINGSTKEKMSSGYISKEEVEELKLLFKKYHLAKKALEKDLIDIRNGIGAHRGNLPWTIIIELWDKLDPESFKPLFFVIPELFECIIKLDIYDWTRVPEEGVIEICCSGLNQR